MVGPPNRRLPQAAFDRLVGWAFSRGQHEDQQSCSPSDNLDNCTFEREIARASPVRVGANKIPFRGHRS
jgi:hypothetical protein